MKKKLYCQQLTQKMFAVDNEERHRRCPCGRKKMIENVRHLLFLRCTMANATPIEKIMAWLNQT